MTRTTKFSISASEVGAPIPFVCTARKLTEGGLGFVGGLVATVGIFEGLLALVRSPEVSILILLVVVFGSFGGCVLAAIPRARLALRAAGLGFALGNIALGATAVYLVVLLVTAL